MDAYNLAEFALTMAEITRTQIEAMGMVAENKRREAAGESPAYVAHHFQELIDSSVLAHNSLIEAGRRIRA